MFFGIGLGAMLTAHWGKSYTLWAEITGATDDETLEAFEVGGCN